MGTLSAAGPVAYDFALSETDVVMLEEMTEDEVNEMLSCFDIDSPTVAVSDSSGKGSLIDSSLSPSTLVLTPGSNYSALPYLGEGTYTDEAEDGSLSSSSDSHSSLLNEYVHPSSFGSESSGGCNMDNPPPPLSAAASSALPSREPSVAPSLGMTRSQCPSFDTTTSMADSRDGQGSAQGISVSYTIGANAFEAAYDHNEDLLASLGPSGQTYSTTASFEQGPFRIDNRTPVPFQELFTSGSAFPPLSNSEYIQNLNAPWPSPQTQAHHGTPLFTTPAGTLIVPPATAMSLEAFNTHLRQHQPTAQGLQHTQYAQRQPPQSQQSGVPVYSQMTLPSYARASRQAPYPTRTAYPPSIGPLPPPTVGPSRQPTRRPLVAADPSTRSAAVLPSQTDRQVSKGGRKRNSHLPEHKRQQTSKMRKVGACWRCALQRDPCDDGSPCGRCMMRVHKGQQYFFDCDRSKLPDFVHDFLPPSMTLMHQKQTIEDCVAQQVVQWDVANPVDVYLTSGYGLPLVWRLHEFKPKTDELLGQFQYLQDPNTGTSTRQQKYSPPFGITKLETSDETHFKTYVDELLKPTHLLDFGWTCFEEETQINDFQARLLDLLCWSYLNTADGDLRDTLGEILRMMIITYIMGHTLTIAEDTLHAVLGRVRHSPRPSYVTPHTSPRLANRQLKFFFAILRNNIYEKILRWQQNTLHTGGSKDVTWLPAFCVMLGFAMVLEEVQRTIQIQADAKAMKGEKSHDEAYQEAYNACDRIDERFKLLVGLFQCKYRDKKWGEGTFGPSTPKLHKPAELYFLQQVRGLLLEKRHHLESRRDVTFSLENQCLYTSRLVARFLLPFTKLPA